jgi:hypothetical protein
LIMTKQVLIVTICSGFADYYTRPEIERQKNP